MRLAVISSHPIQYYAPLFRLLSERGLLTVKVFYTWEKKAAGYDKDFGKPVEWDIPLLEGYDYHFADNCGRLRTDFWGVRNPGLEKEIEAWGAQAILVFGWNYYSHLRAMRHFKNKIEILFRGDSTLLDKRSPIKLLARRFFLSWVYRKIDAALYVGSNNKAYFLDNGLRERQLVFAPHAIDNERFFDRNGDYQRKADKWRKELGIAEDSIAFAFVGKFQEKKDPVLLIDAFRQLEEANVHLILVGNGVLESRLREMAAGDPRIHFLPFQNQLAMPVVYRLGNVFCLPSKGPEETWGLSVNEAMACGRPVLVSDRCGCAIDLVSDHKNGLIFTAMDKKDLAAKMKVFLQDPPALEQMGRASATIIRSWSFERVATAIENVIVNKHE